MNTKSKDIEETAARIADKWFPASNWAAANADLKEEIERAIRAERHRCAMIIRMKGDSQKEAWDKHVASGHPGPATSYHPTYFSWADELLGLL